MARSLMGPPKNPQAKAKVQPMFIQGCFGGNRTSRDAIVMVVQKKHSTYIGHNVDISSPLLSLRKAYPQVAKSDVLLWHEGDFSWEDIHTEKLEGMNVRLCNLKHPKGAWGPPPNVSVPEMKFSVGYRNMIRFYSVTIWNVLTDLGYEYVMRLDDDSNFMSPIQYNLFDALRSQQAVYGYRQESKECGSYEFGPFVDNYLNKHEMSPMHGALDEPYCESKLGQYGFYNNFFITRISWWLQPQVAEFVQAFDASNLIYSQRDNDLIFQTAAVKLFAEPRAVLKYVDWSYAHVTVIDGKWVFGGVSFGTEDPKTGKQQRKGFQKWMVRRWGLKHHTVDLANENIITVKCTVTNRLCGISNCDKSGEHGLEETIGSFPYAFACHCGAPACSCLHNEHLA
ncbi:glycosyltransferase family 15 protein [Seminavis robusta]|uniref:Glycosyltransferase family 15 protein n=1 Tax=Seminavis robusta TaxID=568900 RepID=A0A9N8H2D6_9STRA|nr:glycosyltransferase family 15 protein [Seminavis robusta]|eukprot:Sro17_g012280.1 glycosyltransferase family 15 protein (396) ;mRNA; r:70674-71861